VADRLRERFRKLAELMDEAEDDVLAHMAFPKEHWQQLHSTNPLERLILARSERHTPSYVVVPEELLSHIARASPHRRAGTGYGVSGTCRWTC
jgi:transposase-like protein